MSDRIGAVGHTTSEGNVQIVSELTDDLRDAVVDYQVSSTLETFLWPSHSGKPVQMAHQQAIYDQNLKLIVSHQSVFFARASDGSTGRRSESFRMKLQKANLYILKLNG